MTRNLGRNRVAIVEDHTLFAESLDVALTLEGHDVHRVALSGNERTASSLLATTLRLRARIVLLDLSLGQGVSGLPLVEPLVRSGAAVVVVTGSSDRVLWGEALRSGASAVLSKAEPLNTILAAIRHIGEGRAVMDLESRRRLIGDYLSDRSELHALRAKLDALTPREREVLGHLMLGHTVSEIAAHSVVSEATVRTQVKSILAKLHVSSQIAAVGLAHRAMAHP
ncbi:response regulator transcription factor [Nocardioides sp.]|uniref:response regulator transcription factor n=1 Tax=Nocardioides sp. TaxID=35761 RepID=UPI002B26590D|nr:response regulator transcription factor [Nocardioides sp.]